MALVIYTMEIVVSSIQLFTGLLLGLSLVGIKVRKSVKILVIISMLFGLIYSVGHTFFPTGYVSIILFLLLFATLVRLIKVPVTQIFIALLLALIFNLLIITLLEYNIFYLLLDIANATADIGTKLSIDLFAMLTNIFLSMIIISKSPVLFPKSLFEKSMGPDDSEISFSSQVYSVILILSLIVVGLYYTSIELHHIRVHYRWFLTIWSLAVSIAIILFQRKIISFNNEKFQLVLDQQYQKELLSFFSIIRSQRHDFNFHLSAINGLIQKKEYDACKIYIEDMVKSAIEINDLLPLHHPGTAALLSTFNEKAAGKGIPIEFILTNDLRNCPCSVYEINKVIGNLLQNAVDEVEQHPDPKQSIIVEINSQNNHLLITVTNEINMMGDRLDNLFEVGFSTKLNHEGLGLPAVKKIVEKYQGIVYTELDGGFISFRISIPEMSTTKWG